MQKKQYNCQIYMCAGENVALGRLRHKMCKVFKKKCRWNSKGPCSLEEMGSGLCTSKLIVSQNKQKTCASGQVKLGYKGTALSVCNGS